MYRTQKKYLLSAAIALVAFVGVSCSDDDTIYSSQREKTVSFLESGHDPKLISQSAAESSAEQNPEYYISYANESFRYIRDMYNPARELQPVVERGDRVKITLSAYVFTYAAPTLQYIYYTNDPTLETALKEAGLDTKYWTFEPTEVVAGSGNVIKGVAKSLIGCRNADTVEVYMTYKAAYGDKVIVGTVPKASPVVVVYTINEVVK